MARLYESQCVYCKDYAVLNGYCRQCESTNPNIDPLEECDATANSPYDDEQSPDTTILDSEPDSPN